MSGESDPAQLINTDIVDLDSSDDVIELDSDDAESVHIEGVIGTKYGSDISSVESDDEASRPGLDLVENKPDAKCMTSNNCLFSDGSLASKCTQSAEVTEGNGSAIKQATSKEPPYGEDVLNLESQSNELVGLDLADNKPGAKSMTSDDCIVLEEDKPVQECSVSNDCMGTKYGSDISSVESDDEASRPGLDLVENKPDAKCMTSNNCLFSDGSLASKCTQSAEVAKGNGSATERATSKEPLSESDQKDCLAESTKNGEDVPNLESQNNELVGLDLAEDKPGAKSMTSDDCIVLEEYKPVQEYSVSNDCIGTKYGSDISSVESDDEASRPGLNLVENKPDAKCITSNNCLFSDGSLASKCTQSAEVAEGNGSAIERATSKEPLSESDQKDCLADSTKNGEDVPNLESQNNELVGLDLAEDKPGAKSMTSGDCIVLEEDKPVQECSVSNDRLAVESNLESKDGSNVPGAESTKKTATSDRLSLSKKDIKEISDKKQHSGSDDAKRKSTSSNVEKKDESRATQDSKKRSPSLDRQGSGAKSRRIQSRYGKGSGAKSRRSQSRDRKGSGAKSRRSQSRDRKGSGANDKRSQSRDRQGSGSKSRRSQSRDKKDISTKSGKDQSHDNKGSAAKSEKHESRDKRGSAAKSGKQESSDNKGSAAKSEKQESSDNKGSAAKSEKQESSDNKGSAVKSEKQESSDNKGSAVKSEKHESSDNKGSSANSEKHESRDNKGSAAKSEKHESRDNKGSAAKSEKQESSDNKGSAAKSEKQESSDNKGSAAKSEKQESSDNKGSAAKSEKQESSDNKGSAAKSGKHESSDKKGSAAKSGRTNRSPGKKDDDNSRTKRSRSGSRRREDRVRKRRRVSRSRSRSRRRSRTPFDQEREKTRQVSDILQSQIDRLKEEVEKAREDLRRNERSRSRSFDLRDQLRSDWDSSARTFDQRSPVHYRSRSRSPSRLERSESVTRRTPLPSVQRFLDVSEEKQVVVVKKVDVKDQNIRDMLMRRLRRYGEVTDSAFDVANKAIVLHYKKHSCAQEAAKGMNTRYFYGQYLVAELVNESDAERMLAADVSQSSKRHSRSHSRSRDRRARSSSLGLHFPAHPRHPSSNLFDQSRDLSPLSLLMVTESLRDGGSHSVLFRPKPLRTAMTRTAADLPLCAERLAKREMTMKKMNGIVKCDWGERSLSDFEVLATVGKGTYGQMYKAADKDMKMLMALKRVAVENERSGFPVSALQEMKLLSRLDHPSIVKLVDILRLDQENFVGVKKKGTFYFLYDYMNHDLKRLLQSKLLQLKSEDVAWFIRQLLSALSYCHRFGLVHRDVRPSNILINNRGELKLAQFGLACLYDEKAEPPAPSSVASTEQRMVSLWYRAPELLLGEKKSSPATDIWSCGCVVGEIFSRKPVFLGSDEQHQIEVISKVCGTPNTSNWPDVSVLPLHYILKNVEDYPRLFHDAFHYMPYMARNLLDQLLVMDPAKRLTAESALDTDWLRDADFPKMLPMMLVNINDCHMLMPAKSPIDGDVNRPPGAGKASSVSMEDRKLEGFARSNFVARTRREDVSDKLAIARSLVGSTSAHESDTVWKPLRVGAGRQTAAGVPAAADVQVSREPAAERTYPMSSQLSRRAYFNPRVMDYACQPTYAEPVSVPEKRVLQPAKPYVGGLPVRSANTDGHTSSAPEQSLRYEDQPQVVRRPPNIVHVHHISGTLKSRPAALPSVAKPAAQASDDRTFSADLERLRMLKKKLEMVGTEKRAPLANRAKAGDAVNWNVAPARTDNVGESVEFGVNRFKRSADAGDVVSQDPWANQPLPKRAAVSGQPPTEKTTVLRGAPEVNASRGNVEAAATYRSQNPPAKGPQSLQSSSESAAFGWEGHYNTTREEDFAADVVGRPSIAPGRAPATYRDPAVNRTYGTYDATSAYDDSTPHDDVSGVSGGWDAYQQPEARPSYNRKPLPSQSNPGIRGPPSTSHAREEPSFSYPEGTAEQHWEYNREMADQASRYPGGGFSEESAPYQDERWRADDRWDTEAARPHPGPFSSESDVEWRAPQSRF